MPSLGHRIQDNSTPDSKSRVGCLEGPAQACAHPWYSSVSNGPCNLVWEVLKRQEGDLPEKEEKKKEGRTQVAEIKEAHHVQILGCLAHVCLHI